MKTTAGSWMVVFNFGLNFNLLWLSLVMKLPIWVTRGVFLSLTIGLFYTHTQTNTYTHARTHARMRARTHKTWIANTITLPRMTYIPYDYWLIYSSAIKIHWPNYYSWLLQGGITRYRYFIDIDFSLESDLHEEIVIFLSMVNTYCHMLLSCCYEIYYCKEAIM